MADFLAYLGMCPCSRYHLWPLDRDQYELLIAGVEILGGHSAGDIHPPDTPEVVCSKCHRCLKEPAPRTGRVVLLSLPDSEIVNHSLAPVLSEVEND